MTTPTITCSVIDRRTGQPAVGMSVLLRCVEPRSKYFEFEAMTDADGYIFNWTGRAVSALNLLYFVLAYSTAETTTWQMGFLTTKYFDLIGSSYSVADVNFVVSRGQPYPHITLFADLCGFETRIDHVNYNFTEAAKNLPIEPATANLLTEAAKNLPIEPATANLLTEAAKNLPIEPATTNLLTEAVKNLPIQPATTTLRPVVLGSRRGYKKFSKDQNKALMEHYVDEPHPSSATCMRLSEDLKLSTKQTMNWFRRQRAQRRLAEKQSLLRNHAVAAERGDIKDEGAGGDVMDKRDIGIMTATLALADGDRGNINVECPGEDVDMGVGAGVGIADKDDVDIIIVECHGDTAKNKVFMLLDDAVDCPRSPHDALLDAGHTSNETGEKLLRRSGRSKNRA